MQKEFDNENRSRYYGLRVGDIVEQKAFGTSSKGEVIGYGFLDNNRVYVRLESGEETDFIAEWCEIIKKVEDGEGISE